jgi:hypothetical protein
VQLLTDRNLTSHTYQRAVADQVLEPIQKNYIRMFKELLKTIDLASREP